MGSVGIHHPKGTPIVHPVAAAFEIEIGDISVHATVNRVFYGAYRNRDGHVGALVAPITYAGRRDYPEIIVKLQDETMGPAACEAPARVLDALTAPLNDHVRQWRAWLSERQSAIYRIGAQTITAVTDRSIVADVQMAVTAVLRPLPGLPYPGATTGRSLGKARGRARWCPSLFLGRGGALRG